MMKLIHTDNYGRDYPDEGFVSFGQCVSEDKLYEIANILNRGQNDRFWRVVDDDYILIRGFEEEPQIKPYSDLKKALDASSVRYHTEETNAQAILWIHDEQSRYGVALVYNLIEGREIFVCQE